VYFTLHYRGPLRPNGKPAHKHILRQHFHAQLKELWKQRPLARSTRLLEPDVGSLCLLKPKHGFNFAPLVSQSVGAVAELNILLLWPLPAGFIISSGGDIDNRLKTLLDALKAPLDPSDLPPGTRPAPDEDPFFCLLEDDSLITGLKIETDRLLEPVADDSEVLATVRVSTRLLEYHPLTAGLA
jgi:hypothetical protein